MVLGLIGGIDSPVLGAWIASSHRFEDDQDESIEVICARSDVGVFAIHGSSCGMMESARQQLQGQEVICGRLVQREIKSLFHGSNGLEAAAIR